MFDEFHVKTDFIQFLSIWYICDRSCWNYKENNKKVCDTFDLYFKNIPLLYMYIVRYHSKDIMLH